MSPTPIAPVVVSSWWSFGRDRALLHRAADSIEPAGGVVHDVWSDVDLNRTLVCHSAAADLAAKILLDLADSILPSIDMRRHSGSHDRTGALDRVLFDSLDHVEATRAAGRFGEVLAITHGIPVLLDGPHSDGRSEGRALRLREAGFGGTLGESLEPDFGPCEANPQWGVVCAFVGATTPQCALEIVDPTSRVAARVAETLNGLRMEGDSLFLGVEAGGFAQPTRGGSLLMLEFGQPEDADPDAVLRIAEREARLMGGASGRARALGVWPRKCLTRATRLAIEDRQVWERVRA